jgi:extracellular elastinolytic metalloproteinase
MWRTKEDPVRISGLKIRRPRRAAATAVVAAVVLAGLSWGTASAAPAQPAAPDAGPNLAGSADGHGSREVDRRSGVAAPSQRQRAAAARVDGQVQWNTLGTPASVSVAPAAPASDQPGQALATGLAGDPEAVARQYLAGNQDLFGLDAGAVAALERVAVSPIGPGAAVLLRQRFGDLPAGRDGQVVVAVRGGSVLRVTSSLSRDTSAPEPATLSADQALAAALTDAGLSAAQLSGSDTRLVAVPTPAEGPRAAYEVTLTATGDASPTAFASYVDARTGAVLLRDDLVNYDSDNPRWAVYPATPPASGADQRVIWCLHPADGCAQAFSDPASGGAWDVDVATGTSTLTSQGNSSNDVLLWGAGTPATHATTSPDRNYTYPLTDQWQVARCDPATFTSAQRNDADAAITNLFAMHNRMHDFAYRLGFTEATWNLQAVNIAPGGLGGDAEQGRAQSGALSGSRNNANQGTGRDGQPPVTNMFLWQPVAGAAYPPCVDGDYDMTVIGHEYTHAISNRMIAGPDAGISGFQGGSMGESWSDQVAQEYLYENGYRAPGDTPWVTGAYVTGNNTVGIRDYDLSNSPLNYSDLGFDLVGPEVHADGEIWNATNWRVRQALVGRYGAGTAAEQLSCAQGATPVQSCPGNRRWIQIMFDSFLLQASSSVSMLDMRDNMLAADMIRFGGADQDILWAAFAQSGMGVGASTNGGSDTDAVPSFASPMADNATVTLRPVGSSLGAALKLYVGDYEARAVPVADTDPATALPDTFQVLPGTTFGFTAAGAGFGMHKFSASFAAGRPQFLPLNLPPNYASVAAGATVSGAGVNLDRIADDSEATDWASLDGVAGRQVTVDLAGDHPVTVAAVSVSAMLRPAITGDADPGGQNRFTALRSFAILTCNAEEADCSQDGSYHTVFTSAPDAFPGGAFRPTAGQLTLRRFAVTPSEATHLRLQVLTSQCTGNPQYAGEQDADPRAATDCATASPFAQQVRVAELEAFQR